MMKLHDVTISQTAVSIDGQPLPTTARGEALLTEVYRQRVNDYPKFFKMDGLSRLGWLASELLLQAAGDRHLESDDRAVICFGRSGSVNSDRQYQTTIDDSGDFFPSPSVFVYTLPNIVTGEIAIRNKYYGETAFYLMDEYDEQTVNTILASTLSDAAVTSVIGGWVDCSSADAFEARLSLYIKD